MPHTPNHSDDVPSDHADVIRHLRNKRLIFTVTTGRSGTDYLHRLFSLLPGVASFHETEPNFVDAMRLSQADSTVARQFWLTRKLPAIAQVKAPTYIETSHLFCKGFLEPLLGMGLQPDLIVLKRPHREVATSLYRIQTIPGRTDSGRRYLLDPDDPGVLPLPGWQQLHDYQLCYWYCLEIERRAAQYEQMLRANGSRVCVVSLRELSGRGGFRRLLHELALPSPDLKGWARYLVQRSRRVNTKRAYAAPSDESVDFGAMEQQVHQRMPEPPNHAIAA